ncbi:heme A synthase COX15 isoform X1 [Neodiprion pinetum]|uniref:Cytochrome c oxidase assembly protein COX15 homolog n=1 Tax=Neodiprion lecontei TaxID=441921 RepID=A0A6J0BHF9_NEOLC|nr:cytochrome c oxidase assembly protein COX15 homolog isoform X1 [Neodiprion lecontei]XP_046487421.1 cytochrome c oxidase assembly protein COX15 homolog isoform X1 [Neodiprion pinetum]XP_046487422.1 cytochrome c oxidase assembly protein COX15 homolog isoform X1 [Neodiprion pinetum]XP_046598976.1 cytochrome c oxidase assembly protein COX15 homolog isoform X1 [Neodiprion lecontei]
MLSVARQSTKILGRANLTGSCYVRRTFIASLTRKASRTNGLSIFPRIPVQAGRFQSLLRQTGTIALNYASKATPNSKKIVGTWMLTCSGMVFIAVALGGITRLTESGLSMVTWKLLGERMPLTEHDWIEEFEKYKEFPEFKITNKNITLEEFKRIWWMEYLHRTWGRLIGAAFIIPATFFWTKGWFDKKTKLRVTALGTLIGMQGLMGWYMVKSGLEDRFNGPSDVPRVSQYRLASHLGLAFIIYTGFLYNALDKLIPAQKVAVDYFGTRKFDTNITKGLRKLRMMTHSTKGLIFLTAISGAFVAGMDAGLVYNSFPKMGDKWIPDDILAISPTLRNFTENPTTVQFDHRILGITTLSMITATWWISRKYTLPGRGAKAAMAVLCLGYLQVLLGITTLLHYVPVPLAASHQSGSLALLSAATWLCHELKYVKRLPK